MRSGLGVILKLAAYGVEVACLIGLVKVGGQGRIFAGFPAENWFRGGLGVGLMIWVAGLIAIRNEARRPGDD